MSIQCTCMKNNAPSERTLYWTAMSE